MSKTGTLSASSRIWKFFTSVKLTVVLLIILAVASILGTLIPQGRGAMEFARGLSPEMLQVFRIFDLFDVYNALWFRLLIACLAVNLIVCSVDRFPSTWRRFRARPRPDREKPFSDLPADQQMTLNEALDRAAPQIDRFIRKRLKDVAHRRVRDRIFWSGEKGRYSHFGVYLVHTSILVIIFGALIGSFFGFEGYVNITEDEEVQTITLRRKMRPRTLDFSVRCDRFSVEFYENGTPKEYRSDLSFLVDGEVVKTTTARVNHPAHFQGITFYQANYGTIPGRRVRLRILREASRSSETTLEVEAGETVELPADEGEFRVMDLKGDFMAMGPAVLVRVMPRQGDPVQFWVYQNQERINQRFPGLLERFPKLNPSTFEPYTFFLEDLESRYYTGLQVTKDPGVPVVWFGCFLLVAGFLLTFLTSHRRFWIRTAADGDLTRVSVAGTSNKNPVGLHRELQRFTRELDHHMSQRGLK